MKFAHFALAFGISLACSAPSDAQNVYKSVGADGKAFYSDRPPADGKVAKTLKLENLPNSTLPYSAAAQVERFRKSKNAGDTPTVAGVVLFSAQWCGYCKQAKAYLANKRITYQEVDIDTPLGIDEFAKAGGGKGVPLLIASGQRTQGFSQAAYDAIFPDPR